MNEFFDLDYEWRTLAIVGGEKVLVRLAEDSPWIEVSFPRQAFNVVNVRAFLADGLGLFMNLRIQGVKPTILDDSLIDLLESQGIEVDRSISPNCANGPSDGEIIAAFCLETAGKL
jgi:hypothetical protein